MRILVTGHRGDIGAYVVRSLEGLGHEVVGFDRVDGDDLLDSAAVRADRHPHSVAAARLGLGSGHVRAH